MHREITEILKAKSSFIDGIDELRNDLGRIMPRRIMPPAGHFNPRFWWDAVICNLHPHVVSDVTISPTGKRCFERASDGLTRLGAPTYFPTVELLDALDNTDLDNIDLDQVKMPADSMLFCLPMSKLYEPFDMKIDGEGESTMTVAPVCIAVNLLRQGADGAVLTMDDRTIEMVMLDTKQSIGWFRIPMRGPWSDTVEGFIGKGYFNANDEMVQKYQDEDARKDTEQSRWCYRMVMKLIIAMNTVGDISRPEPTLARSANPKRGKAELWQGHPMSLIRSVANTAGGSHSSPRLHYRRGHMRGQRHGQGNMMTKFIWIRPTWVGRS
jgi:hypothetical protein